ncbi:MAG: RNA polymerase sigma factor [Actinomycetota bacterium]|nr:RNA polymerase sigma factor [Actinomycetota bacterium]
MSGAEATDAELIHRSLEDPEKFREIFERHYDAVRRFAQRIVGRETGEEIAAQTFLIAFERRANYDLGYLSARSWLFGIAYNVARHHLRGERSQHDLLARVPRPREATDPIEIETLDAARLAPILRKALSELRQEQRSPFLLVALGELTYQETADVLAIPVGSVRSRIHRARATLRELLTDVRETLDGGDEAIARTPDEATTEDPEPHG